MPPRHPAFTLLELLLVVAIVGILVGVLLPNMQPAVYDQLRSTAQIVATDLAYARSLAVANNDNYRITFDLNANQYVLTHSGTNAALNTLPKTPFSSPGDPADSAHRRPRQSAARRPDGPAGGRGHYRHVNPIGRRRGVRAAGPDDPCRSDHDLADGGRRQRPEIHDVGRQPRDRHDPSGRVFQQRAADGGDADSIEDAVRMPTHRGHVENAGDLTCPRQRGMAPAD